MAYMLLESWLVVSKARNNRGIVTLVSLSNHELASYCSMEGTIPRTFKGNKINKQEFGAFRNSCDWWCLSLDPPSTKANLSNL